MGIKTVLTCKEAKSLFTHYDIGSIYATKYGIMDTTYISKNYIIKKYERDIDEKIDFDINLLADLNRLGLNVSKYIAQKEGWYLYRRLKGEKPTHICSYHISSLARFLSMFHSYSVKKRGLDEVIDADEIDKLLSYVKSHFYFYYKKLSPIKEYKVKNDGIIHGDIFKDNTLFNGQKVAVFDFIDSGNGDFCFDMAVLLVGFEIKKHHRYKIELFLKVYNQHAPKKCTKKALLYAMDMAKYFYTLKRVYTNKKIQKELL